MTLIRETRQSRSCVRENDVVTHSPWGDDPTWRMAYFSTQVGWARNCQQVMPSWSTEFFLHPHPMFIWESWCVLIGISCFQEFSICAFSYVGDWCWWTGLLLKMRPAHDFHQPGSQAFDILSSDMCVCSIESPVILQEMQSSMLSCDTHPQMRDGLDEWKGSPVLFLYHKQSIF